jgi:hypothetical protein
LARWIWFPIDGIIIFCAVSQSSSRRFAQHCDLPRDLSWPLKMDSSIWIDSPSFRDLYQETEKVVVRTLVNISMDSLGMKCRILDQWRQNRSGVSASAALCRALSWEVWSLECDFIAGVFGEDQSNIRPWSFRSARLQICSCGWKIVSHLHDEVAASGKLSARENPLSIWTASGMIAFLRTNFCRQEKLIVWKVSMPLTNLEHQKSSSWSMLNGQERLDCSSLTCDDVDESSGHFLSQFVDGIKL